jgi:dihydropteroate synthase
MRILDIDSFGDLRKVMQELKVDPYGIRIMAPKAIAHLLRINSVSNIVANILKQEMLSLGGDVAIAKDALTGKVKKTDCLIIGNLSQFNRLGEKLKRQPFGLSKIATELNSAINNYQKHKFLLKLGKYKLNLGMRPYIMGIINLTPDSFSGDGLYSKFQFASFKSQVNNIIEYAQELVKEGADILDIGGESSRPGARPVSLKEEIRRTIPIIRLLAKKVRVPISIDTYKPEVAKEALYAGAAMVNDISGLRNIKLAKLIAKTKSALIIMHMKGRPLTMQKTIHYQSLLDDIITSLNTSINIALDCGIYQDKIIIDPGIGFGKTLKHNLEILKNLKEFKILGKPILIGTSRKSFIGKILKLEPKERIMGTVSSSILAVQNGANIVRVHDVKEVKQALMVNGAINNSGLCLN